MICALLLSGTAPACASIAFSAKEPMTRIRGVPRTIELNQEQFSGWMNTVWRHGKPRTYAAALPLTPPTPREEFLMADSNQDGVVTKDELADYLVLPTTV